MDGTIAGFFVGHREALPIYIELEGRMLDALGAFEIRVQKTQISFYDKHLFACVSFMHPRRKRDLPEPYLVVTLGLDHRLDSPRIGIATEPYPNRWTHHIVLSAPCDVDDELMGWIADAADLARRK